MVPRSTKYNSIVVHDAANAPVIVDVSATIASEPGRPSVLIDQVRRLLEGGAHYVLLNVANISYADSLVLGAIMQAYAAAMRRGATLRLMNTSRRFGELLTVTK